MTTRIQVPRSTSEVRVCSVYDHIEKRCDCYPQEEETTEPRKEDE